MEKLIKKEPIVRVIKNRRGKDTVIFLNEKELICLNFKNFYEKLLKK